MNNGDTSQAKNGQDPNPLNFDDVQDRAASKEPNNEKKKGRPVYLNIVGKQWQLDNEPVVTRYTTEGLLYDRGDETVIVYKQSAVNGFKHTFSTLTLRKDQVTLVWNGDHHVKMNFANGRRHVSNLTTPQGVISLGIFTSAVDVSKLSYGGEVHVRYALDGPDAPALNTHLDIDYRFVK